MSGNGNLTNDRSQQGALERLHALQDTAEFLHQAFPTLWEEPGFSGVSRDHHKPYNGSSHEDMRGASRAVERRNFREEVEYYDERAIPVPNSNLPNGGPAWPVAQEVTPFFRATYGHVHSNGRLNGHHSVYNGNGNVRENGYHAEDHQESNRQTDKGHRRRSE